MDRSVSSQAQCISEYRTLYSMRIVIDTGTFPVDSIALMHFKREQRDLLGLILLLLLFILDPITLSSMSSAFSVPLAPVSRIRLKVENSCRSLHNAKAHISSLSKSSFSYWYKRETD